MFAALKRAFLPIQLTNEQKKEYLLKYLTTYNTCELESILRELKEHVKTVDSDREDFDSHYDQLIFGFILYSRCYEEKKYGVPWYPVQIDEVYEIMKEQDGNIQRLCNLGKHVLNEKRFPLTDGAISFHIQDAGFAQYILQRFKQYDTIAFDDYELGFVRTQLEQLAPQAAMELFSTIDVNDGQFDYLMMGLITFELSTKGKYPIPIEQLYLMIESSKPKTASEYAALFMKLGQLIFENKSIPVANLKQIPWPNHMIIYAAKRCAVRAHMKLGDYLAKQVIVELCEALPHDVPGSLEDLSKDNPLYDYTVAGLAIYALVLNDEYLIPKERFFQHCGIDEISGKTEGEELVRRLQQQFLTIGKLALDKKAIPVGTLYPEKALDKRLNTISKDSSDFFNHRICQYEPKSSQYFEALDKLVSLLPKEAHDLSSELVFNHTKRTKILYGMIIYLMASQNKYPISMLDLKKLCSINNHDALSDFKNLFLELGALALEKRTIPFSDKDLVADGITKKEFDALVHYTPIHLLSFVEYKIVKELHDQMNCDVKRSPVIYSMFGEGIIQYLNYVYGLYVYILAERGEYPVSKNELIAMCYQKPIQHSLYGFFYKEYATSAPVNAGEYDKLFIAIGEHITKNKTLPFGEALIDKNPVGLSDGPCEFLKRMSGLDRFLFLSFEDYEMSKTKEGVSKCASDDAGIKIKNI